MNPELSMNKKPALSGWIRALAITLEVFAILSTVVGIGLAIVAISSVSGAASGNDRPVDGALQAIAFVGLPIAAWVKVARRDFVLAGVSFSFLGLVSFWFDPGTWGLPIPFAVLALLALLTASLMSPQERTPRNRS